TDFEKLRERLVKVLQRETLFGTGVEFRKPEQHDVLDEDWSLTPVTARVFEKARGQLGTSGSGNHFVEFGILTVSPAAGSSDACVASAQEGDTGVAATVQRGQKFDLPPGQYLAVLSHSGSRGAGATVADFYSRLAMDLHPELPAELRRLAWLDLS